MESFDGKGLSIFVAQLEQLLARSDDLELTLVSVHLNTALEIALEELRLLGPDAGSATE